MMQSERCRAVQPKKSHFTFECSVKTDNKKRDEKYSLKNQLDLPMQLEIDPVFLYPILHIHRSRLQEKLLTSKYQFFSNARSVFSLDLNRFSCVPTSNCGLQNIVVLQDGQVPDNRNCLP